MILNEVTINVDDIMIIETGSGLGIFSGREEYCECLNYKLFNSVERRDFVSNGKARDVSINF
jgi:hypothetical protein